LRQAYPSYFLDTNDFISNLEIFEKKCQVFK
jgi:hypothetical protein